MESKTRIFLIILSFLVQLSLLSKVHAGPLPISHEGSRQGNFLPVSLPERNHLSLVSIVPVTLQGETVARVAIYDDSMTKRSADYLEIYNVTGDLVAVSWFDRFGIERTAVDRGLLEDRDELKGVFVVLLDGEAV